MSTTASQASEFRVCLFELGGQRFGLRLESIAEIVPIAALARPPSTPPLVEGFLNLRGTSVPVLRLAALLGMSPDRPGLHTPLLIVRSGDLRLAFLVKSVAAIVSIPAAALAPISALDSFNGCVEGVVTSGDESFHVLSVDRLLLEKERQSLSEFQAIETRRLHQIELPLS